MRDILVAFCLRICKYVSFIWAEVSVTVVRFVKSGVGDSRSPKAASSAMRQVNELEMLV